MADSKAAPPDPQDQVAQGRHTPTSFAQVAKRISTWTTNTILTALVLVLGLGFGRQVLQWWAADRSDSPAARPLGVADDGLGDLGRAHEIQFGASCWRLRRQTVAGTRQQALDALRADTREVIRSSFPSPGEPEAAEKRLLLSLQEQKPVDREPGQWGIYQLDQDFPMVVGTRESGASGRPNPAGPVALSGCRVVTWGLAVPMSPRAWTLYTFHQGTPSASRVPDLPSPPNSSRLLALRVAGGGAVVAIRGPTPPEVWRSFYDRWFQSQGWTAAGAWQQRAGVWSRGYVERPDGPAAKVDIQFGVDGRGGMSGLLMFTPAASADRGSEGL